MTRESFRFYDAYRYDGRKSMQNRYNKGLKQVVVTTLVSSLYGSINSLMEKSYR